MEHLVQNVYQVVSQYLGQFMKVCDWVWSGPLTQTWFIWVIITGLFVTWLYEIFTYQDK